MKLRYFTLVGLVVLVLGFIFISYVELPFSINTRGVIYPLREWRVVKSDDGSLLNMLKNYSNNTVSYYSVTEFQRGDFAEFIVNESVYTNEIIEKGDTIGHIKSNEEQRRYLELQGELESQKKLLEVHSTGAKPEDVAVARENIALAQQEYDAQKKITERNRILHEEEYISDEEWEASLDRYNSRKLRLRIAEAEYDALTTGDKQERLDYIKANILAIEEQISQIERRIQSFSILSPFTGVLVKQQTGDDDETAVIRLADISEFVVVLPVELYQLDYIEPGQKITLALNTGRRTIQAEIIDIDNTVQMINFRQNVFVTASIHKDDIEQVLPNMVVESEIDCGMIPAKEYVYRLFRTVHQN